MWANRASQAAVADRIGMVQSKMRVGKGAASALNSQGLTKAGTRRLDAGCSRLGSWKFLAADNRKLCVPTLLLRLTSVFSAHAKLF